ncbi:MAG: polar amino acid transport system substrate-binding protein [bacterium]|jgi:polar amino acid transport system substrate-binding protein
MKRITLFILKILFLLSFSPYLSAKEKITAWFYYQTAPFHIKANQGFSYDFGKLLNKLTKDSPYSFSVEMIPRKRLNKILKKQQQGVVLFVQPQWMGDPERKKYLWTNSFMKGRNEVLSHYKRPIYYKSPSSLYGLRFGGILGRKYTPLEKAFHNHQVQRFDVNYEKLNLFKLNRRRIDVTVQPKIIAKYLIHKYSLQSKIFFSSNPLVHFNRHILVTKKLTKVHQLLNQIILQLRSNQQWKVIQKNYQLL